MDRVGLEIELLGYENFKKKMSEAQKIVKTIDGRKIKIDLSQNWKGLNSQFRALGREVRDYTSAIREAKIAQNQLRDSLNGITAKRTKGIIGKNLIPKDQLKKITNLDFQGTIKRLSWDKGHLQTARAQLQNAMEITPRINWQKAFNTGYGAFQKAGRSLETIGNAFTSVSRNPFNTMLRGVAYSLSGSMMGIVNEGLTKSVSRFDTMRTYPKMMEAIGFSTEDAQESIERLNESVLGLPTGLDEIVDKAKRYSTTLNDITRGTDVAIAANNAFLASASTDTQQYQGMMQLQDVLTGKKLNTREWMSLAASMSTAMRQVSKVMGYTDHAQFLQDLYGNQIANADFIDALIKAGTGEGALVQMAGISKSTMAGVIANIKVAFSRLGASVLEGLDAALISSTGKNLVETLRGIIDQIDDLGARLVKWVNNNPQVIKKWMDTIRGFDLLGFIRDYAEGFKQSIDLLMNLLKQLAKMGGGNGRNILAWFMGFSTIGGRIITTIGQLVKGLAPIGGLLGVLGTALKHGGIFDALGGFFSKFGGLGKAIHTAKVEKLGRSLEVAQLGFKNAVAKLKLLLVDLGMFVAVGGAITAIVGEVWAVAKIIESLGKIEVDWGSATENLMGAGTLMTAFGFVAMGLRPILPELLSATLITGAITTAISAFAALDLWLIKKAAENIKGLVVTMGEIDEELQGFSFKNNSDYKIEKMILFVSGLGQLATIVNGGIFAPLVGALSRNSTKSLEVIVENLLGTIKKINALSEELKNVKAPSQASLEKIKDIGEFIKDFYGVFDNDTFDLSVIDGGTIGESESKNLNTIIWNFESAVSSIKAIVDSYANMVGTLDNLFTNDRIGSSPIQRVQMHIKEMVGNISSIFQTFASEFSKAYEVRDRQGNVVSSATNIADSKEMSKNMNDIIGAFSETIGSIEQIVNTMKNMGTTLTGLLTTSLGGNDLARIKNGIETLLGTIKDIFGTFNEYFDELFTDTTATHSAKGNTVLSFGKSAKSVGKDMNSITTAFSETIGAISSIVTAMTEMATPIEALVSGGKIFGIADRIEIVLKEIARVSTAMTSGEFANLDAEEMSAKMHEFSKAIGSIKNAMIKLNEARGQIDAIGIPTGGTFDLADKIRNVVSQLSNSLGGANGEGGLTQKAWQFKFAISQVTTSLENLVGTDTTGLAGVEQALKNLVDAFEYVTEQSTGLGKKWHTNIIDGFNADALRTTIQGKIRTLFSSVQFYYLGNTAGTSFVQGFNSALSGLNKDLFINVHASVSSVASSIGSVGAGIRSLFNSTGGYIGNHGVQYRAFGGSIFRRRGTDTVPVMATPGEYMMRKHAVDVYGKGFMQKINNLDIGGAMKELSVRFGASVGTATRIINNTTNNDNHAKVTQNITTNNPNYSFRRANKWVRALT